MMPISLYSVGYWLQVDIIKMRKEEIEVFESIERVQKNQGLLLQRPKNAQQELFQLCAQRFLVTKQMLHKHIDQVLSYLPGSFAHLALNMLYLSVCIELRVELNTEDHPLLKKLLDWTEAYPEVRNQKTAKLVGHVIPKNDVSAFQQYEEYLTYINFIGGDLLKLIKKQKAQKQQPLSKNIDVNSFFPLDADDLLVFLLNSLPKVLYNIILPNDVLPAAYKQKFKAMQVLYRVSSHEYFMKSKNTYSVIINILVTLLIKMELKPAQQKLMMEVVFRYFFAYHNDKKFAATDIFIEAYNSLSQTTRFAMADEFVLFFKIIGKVGKGKFVDFLVQKSSWLKQVFAKVSDKNMVGYAKQNFSPYPNLRINETITIGNGKSEIRTFQIVQDFSLLYFSVDVLNHDINLRLYYLGEITDRKAVKTLLMAQEKLSGSLKTNLMATKQGIYQFEFDNTYSWINAKTIKFQKILLTPLEIQIPDQPKWTQSYYDNLNLNKITDRNKVYLINSKPQPSQPQFQGLANITKSGKFFNLKITKAANIYEFQTASEDKIVKKFNQIIERDSKLKWMVDGEPLQQRDNLKQMIARSGVEKEREVQLEKKEKIDSKYQQSAESPKKTRVSQEQQSKTTQNSQKQEPEATK